MNYEVEAIPNFRKDLKKLAKKYTSIKEDFGNLLQSLEQNPVQGTFLGNNCYKIRMAITSKGKGKSGGSRVIIFVKVSQKTVFLLSIYDKSEKEDISNTEIIDLLQSIPV
jgi:mRNA-degrading endonuclease RelE of RelBE toxin-antitoxin system